MSIAQTIMKRYMLAACTLLLCIALPQPVFAAAPAPVDELTLRRAEEVALMDAWAKLSEFAVGMAVTMDAKVRDLTEVEQKLAGTLRSSLSRISNQELHHYENGLVQCKVTVDMNELRRFLAGVTERDVADISDEEWLSDGYEPEPAPEYLEVWGNGALAGSAGVPIAHAIRAAELDASAQLAVALKGTLLDRRTRVRDFTLSSDVINSLVDTVILGVRYTAYRTGTKIVEVDAEVSFDTIEHTATGKAAVTRVLASRKPSTRDTFDTFSFGSTKELKREKVTEPKVVEPVAANIDMRTIAIDITKIDNQDLTEKITGTAIDVRRGDTVSNPFARTTTESVEKSTVSLDKAMHLSESIPDKQFFTPPLSRQQEESELEEQETVLEADEGWDELLNKLASNPTTVHPASRSTLSGFWGVYALGNCALFVDIKHDEESDTYTAIPHTSRLTGEVVFDNLIFDGNTLRCIAKNRGKSFPITMARENDDEFSSMIMDIKVLLKRLNPDALPEKELIAFNLLKAENRRVEMMNIQTHARKNGSATQKEQADEDYNKAAAEMQYWLGRSQKLNLQLF